HGPAPYGPGRPPIRGASYGPGRPPFRGASKAMWNEVMAETPRMWAQRDYSYEGEHFGLPPNHDILPEPLYGTHPPSWVACGSPATFTTAGSMGIGAIAFNFEPAPALEGRIDSCKEAIAECSEPHGSYMNDNVMMTNAVICLDGRDRAREIALTPVRGYLYSMVCLYHDAIAEPEGAPTGPEPPTGLPEEATLDFAIDAGYMLCGTPEEVCGSWRSRMWPWAPTGWCSACPTRASPTRRSSR
ncbi:MAG: LLM class flavin-dependent oxidoreductase, partial [Acidimicrobiaceae bacterium]|nr:LLM class flavin-dependent oxidoreductase [Acidimicrobiaceae bacterium]MYE75866.1 LLM class flavin-dependent oxidoreductase [Acidimicrobiaceae bacterium]MYH42199.1 LLM class flavin-dependent oxidoreductase [Acidimicrobiaceae bacterium]MYJ42282.1 LLM class flavin-dependent oxidoreductase [Acidimicrobiaceae bacterium]